MKRLVLVISLMLFPLIANALTPADRRDISAAQVVPLEHDQVYNLRDTNRDLYCVAQAAFFEARGEGFIGQLGVSEVVMNRVRDNRFPNTTCSVVNESRTVRKGERRVKVCQFSWTCYARRIKDVLANATPATIREWRSSIRAALMALEAEKNYVANGAIFFQHKSMSTRRTVVASVNNHIYMR